MEPIQPGKYYHIYNRGNNREDLFRVEENYLYFLRLYEKYIHPVAETFAWVLMKNHFHLLVRIKEEVEIKLEELPKPVRVLYPDRVKLKQPHLYFSDLFNSYTQAYNKRFSRTGSLFERPFHRIHIDSDRYFRQLVVYIHHNPQHHGFVDNFKDYPWSSYSTILSVKPTNLSRQKVLGWFDDKANFVKVHSQGIDRNMLENMITE